MLLARSVILVDKQGIVRYIQVMPEVLPLPDTQGAFARERNSSRNNENKTGGE